MNYSEVTEYASLGFVLNEICTVMELDSKKFEIEFHNENSQFRKAYEKGRLLTLAKIRKSEIDLASRGHTEAQKRVEQIMLNQKTTDE